MTGDPIFDPWEVDAILAARERTNQPSLVDELLDAPGRLEKAIWATLGAAAGLLVVAWVLAHPPGDK